MVTKKSFSVPCIATTGDPIPGAQTRRTGGRREGVEGEEKTGEGEAGEEEVGAGQHLPVTGALRLRDMESTEKSRVVGLGGSGGEDTTEKGGEEVEGAMKGGMEAMVEEGTTMAGIMITGEKRGEEVVVVEGNIEMIGEVMVAVEERPSGASKVNSSLSSKMGVRATRALIRRRNLPPCHLVVRRTRVEGTRGG